MAVTPGTYNMTIQRGSIHELTFDLKDSSDAAYDLNYGGTNPIIYSHIYNKERTGTAVSATCTKESTTGRFTWKLTDTQTRALTDDQYYYDVLLYTDGTTADYWVEGVITMSEGYSAPP
tara:strand:+ start:184 stop:540 length:357 start_codon:yes stop_codon:yes gene_type:complete